MAMTERVVNFRGRRPGVATLDGRLKELENHLATTQKISNRRLSEMHEAATLIEHHYAGHKENGEKVADQLRRVQAALDDIVARAELPQAQPEQRTNGNGSHPLAAIRRIREERTELARRIEELTEQEQALYPELGRITAEESLGAIGA